MTVSLLGTGAFYPETVRTNDAWPSTFASRGHASGDRTLNDIPRSLDEECARVTDRHLVAEASDPFLGVESRRVADRSATAVEYEIAASRRALEDADVRGSDVDVVISYSAISDRVLPTAPGVARALGCDRALAFGMDAACATPITQLVVARSMVRSGAARTVLLTQSHLMTRAFPWLHPAGPGIGDAATAMVVGARSRWPIVGLRAATHADEYDAITWMRGDAPEGDRPWCEAGGEFRLGSLDTGRAKALMRDTVGYGVRTLRELCAEVGCEPTEIALLASVQPRGFIPPAIAEVLGLQAKTAHTTYAHLAHLGGCGPIANFQSARELGLVGVGDLVAFYAQGAGFTRGAALIRHAAA